MTNEEDKSKLFKSEKWLYYQDVKVLKMKVKPTDEDKKKVEDFRRFIDRKIKEEATEKKN